MSKFEWNILKSDLTKAEEIATKFDISKISAAILLNRGITDYNEIASFLDPYLFVPENPFLLHDMDKAVLRINKAIENNEKITVFGDYDVDGITSTALVCRYLKSRGVTADFFIPDRFSDGYGLNSNALKEIKDNGTSLVITVDCGIVSTLEAIYASEIGLDLIITDHHKCKEEIPSCVAVINPHYKKSKLNFTEIAGVGVAFKLISALESNTPYHKLLVLYSDLVALGTIADVMPITNENRIIVTAGLRKITRKRCVCGITELIASCVSDTSKITVSTIAFSVAPRINAAGRIAKASKAVELLLTDDNKLALNISAELSENNVSRQTIEKDMMTQAIDLAEKTVSKDDYVVVLSKEGWHHGILGIVASKLCTIYKMPTVLISTNGEEGKGSSRSSGTFDIYAAFTATEKHLIAFGGHKKAAGLTIKTSEIPQFRKAINDYAKEHYKKQELIPLLNIDYELKSEDISVFTANSLSKLEPFGNKNEQPCFLIKDLKINQIIPLSSAKHTKLSLTKDGRLCTALLFGTPTKDFTPLINDKIDIACNLDINEFRGEKTIQLKVLDYKKTEEF
ncbi:MAG: single-stranded-DNA-specific exonuclease RecJ [Clostridia bacterium]